jgi:hypothetical protein
MTQTLNLETKPCFFNYRKSCIGSLALFCISFLLFMSLPVRASAQGDVENANTSAVRPRSVKTQASQVQPSSTKLNGKVSKDDLIYDLDSRFGIECSASNNKAYKATITKIRLGSAALYGGLSVGDHILRATPNHDGVQVDIERGGKIYSARLMAQKPLVAAAAPESIAPQINTGSAPAKIKDKPPRDELDLLAERDIVFIIDESGSMRTADCPGDLSRWNWCGTQSIGLMQEASSKVKEVTVCLFDAAFDVFPHCSLKKVEDIFATRGPGTTTWTAGPIEDRLRDYFDRRSHQEHGQVKPLLMVVITDGEPNVPVGYEGGKEAVEQAIIRATQKMSDPSEIRIAFLEVGHAAVGPDFLYNLDHMLVYKGAKYDIVTTKSFPDLVRIGLKRAIIDAIVASPGQDSTGAK